MIVSGPDVSIILTRSEGSRLPPMIAAMEVFTEQDTNGNYTTQLSAAGREYILFAYSLIIPSILLLIA